MLKTTTVIYLITLHIFLAVVVWKSDFLERVQKKFGNQQAVSPPEITEQFHRMMRFHRRIDGNVPDGAVIFLGDSMAQSLCVSAVHPNSVNFGIGGDTTVGVLQRLDEYTSFERASAIVLTIGGNDIERRSNDEILKNIRTIIERLPKRIPVILCGVLPVDEELWDGWKGRNQNRVISLNAEIARFVASDENLDFVNVGPQVVDEKKNLADKFHDGDGVHLNSEGNALLIQLLQQSLQRER